MHSFLRTFHPVGQGAFYTEQHLVSPALVNELLESGFYSHFTPPAAPSPT